MNQIWNISIDDYLEVIKLAKANGKVAGDSMQEEFFQVMKEKGNKPLGSCELTKEEYINEAVSKGKTILDMSNDEKGTEFKIIKKKTDLDK